MINNLKYIFLALLLSLVLFETSYSQVDKGDLEKNLKNASFKQKFETANSFMEDYLYEFATKIWLNLIEEQPANSNINYKLGLCYLHSSLERNKALKYLLIAGENVSKKYNPFSSGETNAPFEIHHYLGQAYHLNERFDEALGEYQIFKEEVNTKHTLFNKNQRYSNYSINAKIEVAAKKNFKITNIGIPINGEFSDFNPVITADQSTMFFTSRRLRTDTSQVSNEFIFSSQDGRHHEDIYVAYKDIKTGAWEEPELMDFSNPRSNQATISVSGDGQFLFIYKDNDGDGNIYVSEREGFDYGELKYLGGENTETDINSPYWETHATLSADGKTLYFVSDRPGGLGGRDIYRSVKLPNNEWSKALNVGAPINSEYDEDSPFFHPDGKTLYFSSNGNKSMGGFDIFFSKKKTDGTWGDPLNIGYPLNTVGDDVYFSTTIDGKKGYYSSSHEGGLGREDIYSIKLDTAIIEPVSILKGYIDKGSELELPAGITIWVTNLTEDGDPIKYKPNRRTGSYIFALVPCHEYLVEYMQGENTFHETDFTVPCNSDYHVIDKVITLGDLSLNDSDTNPDADTTITQNTIEIIEPIENVEPIEPIEPIENVAIIEPISYQKFYGYNEKGVESEEERVKTFLDGIQSILELKETVNIEVEGSASYVPTKTFGSNKKLSTYRSNEAKEMLMNKLEAAGVDLSKVKIIAINSVVQGPRYKGDFKDTEKYGKFQYIKLKAF